MTANIDVGGYAWARYGFTPDSASVTPILEHATEVMQKYIDKVKSGNIETKNKQQTLSMLQGLQADFSKELQSGNPKPELIRKVAALELPVPNDLHDLHPKYDGQPVDLGENKLTLGKACLLGQDWVGEFNLAENSSHRKLLNYYVQSKSSSPLVSKIGKMMYGQQVQ